MLGKSVVFIIVFFSLNRNYCIKIKNIECWNIFLRFIKKKKRSDYCFYVNYNYLSNIY